MSRNRIIGFGGAFVLAVVIGARSSGRSRRTPCRLASDADLPAAAPSSSAAPAVKPVAAGTYCETYRAAYAAALGVDVADLAPAAAEGGPGRDRCRRRRWPPERGASRATQGPASPPRMPVGCAKVLERIGTAQPERPAAGVVRDGADAAAKALGMTSAELRAELRSGKDLKAHRRREGRAVRDGHGRRARPGQGSTRCRRGGRHAHPGTGGQDPGQARAEPRRRSPATRPPRCRRRRPAVEPGAQSKTMTWRSPSPERSRSKAGSRSSRPIRRSMRRSTGSRPSRCHWA